jgi:predicted AAA+ superfamily ATPase
LNINRISQDLGVSRHTIAEYLQILEDCLIFERIDPLIKTATRRRLSKSAKFIFFDMGTRRMAARDAVTQTSKIYGEWFEQWVGLELLHLLRITAPQAKLRYWQDHTGPEIDYVIEHEQKFLPIEVKWTQTPTLKDARHFSKFIEEYDCITPGIIICRCVKPLLLTEHVLALPWQEITQICAWI